MIRLLTPTHAYVIGGFSILGVAVLAAGWMWPSIQLLAFSGFVILILIFLVALIIDSRTNMLLLESVHQTQLREELDNIFSQLESLLRLNHLIAGKPELPQTRHWAASPDFLVQIYKQIETQRPRTILELGSGLTTLVAAYALRNLGYGGIIHSVDHSDVYLKKTRRELRRHGLEAFVTFHEAPLAPVQVSGLAVTWYNTRFLQKIDAVACLIVDGPPLSAGRHARYPALPLIKAKLSPGAFVLVDDAAREDEKAVVSLWLEESPEFQKFDLASEKGCVLLQKS